MTTTPLRLGFIGLGIMGLHDMLIQMELSYGSEEGRLAAAEVMAFIRSEAEQASGPTAPRTTSTHAGPPGIAVTLDAGLGGGDEFHFGQAFGSEVEGSEALLREHEGGGFGVGERGLAGDDNVHAGGDEFS